jgi:hypothetical protein
MYQKGPMDEEQLTLTEALNLPTEEQPPEFYYFHGTPCSSCGEFPPIRNSVKYLISQFAIGMEYELDVGEDVFDENDQILRWRFLTGGTIKSMDELPNAIRFYNTDGSILEIMQDDDKYGWWMYDDYGLLPLNRINF